MRSRTLFSSVVIFALLAGAAGWLSGLSDQVELASRGPRFLWAPAGDVAPADASDAELLHRRVSITLYSGTLDEALKEIARQARLELIYSEALVPAERRVTLQAQDITVAAALTEVLLDSGVDVVILPTGQVGLVRKGSTPKPTLPGTVTGTVTEAETGNPIVNAQVAVDGQGRTFTDSNGRYSIEGVTPGLRTVSVTSIGYASASQEIEVGDEARVTVDFALEVSPSTLDELVVTATGQRRRVELGHVVGRINADSIARVAPVSSLSELLTARVPGLQVFTHGGLVGGSVSLQARTPNSISLGSEPIIFVDGVRYENSYPGVGFATGEVLDFRSEETSRLNDLNPNDIESIEVVKGPSAATLYGTDAANGVILITTKRGQAGETRWNAYARSALSEIPRQQYPSIYWGWGTVFGRPDHPFISCTLDRLASGQCTQQDSIAALPSAFNDPELTVFHSKPSWDYGASVSGGSQNMRYYFSGNFEQATGPIQMPTEALERLLAERGVDALPDEQFEPNAQRQMTLRGNVTLDLGPTAEVQFNSGYGHTSVRTGQSSYSGFLSRNPLGPYGSSDPADLFSETSTEGTDRVFGSVLGQWRPQTWLQGRATLGVDLGNSERYSLALPGESRFSPTGQVQEVRIRRLGITADVGLSAQARVGRLSFRTAVGSQYTRQKTNSLTSAGRGLPPGGESVEQAEEQFASQEYAETATLGSYVEETIGLNNRLFVSGALRVDGASNFGRDYEAAVYPKASVSWLVSEEPFMPRVPGLDELRFRYAFGASGQQPFSHMTLPRFFISDALVDSISTTAIAPDWIGNPELRPERVREHEAGLDVTGLAGRLQLGLTWFDRTVTDQLVLRPVSLGFGSVYRNLGRMSAHGFEADLTVRPIETRPVTWQITLQHTFLSTRVEDLGDLTESRGTFGGYVEGYPLGARFSTEILGWDDANGDGILVPAELQMSSEATFQGASTPPRTQTLSTSVGLFQQRVRLSALLQRLSGYTQINGLSCGSQLCRAAVDTSTPLEAQALLVAPSAAFPYANIEPADHTRLQEVTLAVDLPEALLRGVGLGTGTLTLSGRNLALWTSFSGPDPASASVRRFFGGVAENIPQSRTWVVRLDLGW